MSWVSLDGTGVWLQAWIARWGVPAWLAICLVIFLAACGGGASNEPGDPSGHDSSDGSAATSHLESLSVPGFPHAVAVYRTAGATQALVVLHGGGGQPSAIAYQLGLNSQAQTHSDASILWSWLEAQHLMLVLPQGQHLASEPNATTWSNHAMSSGQDDQAFLVALAAQIRRDYGMSKVSVAGHSMGGAMVNRLWCEAPASFDAYISVAGPASSWYLAGGTPCLPSVVKPYLGIIGDADTVMQNGGEWDAPQWTVSPVWVQAAVTAWLNDRVVAEWAQQQRRSQLMCGEPLDLGAAQVDGAVSTWHSCGGRLVLSRVQGGDHGVRDLDQRMGEVSPLDVMNRVAAFLER